VRDRRRFEGYSQWLGSDVLKASGALISDRLTPSIFVCRDWSRGPLCLSTMQEHFSVQAARPTYAWPQSCVWMHAWSLVREQTSVTAGQDVLQQLVRRHPKTTSHCFLLMQPSRYQLHNIRPNAALQVLQKLRHNAAPPPCPRLYTSNRQLASTLPSTLHPASLTRRTSGQRLWTSRAGNFLCLLSKNKRSASHYACISTPSFASHFSFSPAEKWQRKQKVRPRWPAHKPGQTRTQPNTIQTRTHFYIKCYSIWMYKLNKMSLLDYTNS